VATVSESPPPAELIEATRVVWLHHRPVGAAGPFVDIDNEKAGRLAMEHLLSHGIKNPLVVTGPTDAGPVGPRLTGALRAAADGGLDPESIPVARTEFSRFDAADKVASFSRDIDSVLATTDEHGIGVLAALGRRVPEDVAVVAIDGTEAAPSLTTVEAPIRAMAERAVELALADDPESNGNRFEVSLRLARSCGCQGTVHGSDD
jgi:LacI family transcriptional regulator